jgi:hypothetical protein
MRRKHHDTPPQVATDPELDVEEVTPVGYPYDQWVDDPDEPYFVAPQDREQYALMPVTDHLREQFWTEETIVGGIHGMGFRKNLPGDFEPWIHERRLRYARGRTSDVARHRADGQRSTCPACGGFNGRLGWAHPGPLWGRTAELPSTAHPFCPAHTTLANLEVARRLEAANPEAAAQVSAYLDAHAEQLGIPRSQPTHPAVEVAS